MKIKFPMFLRIVAFTFTLGNVFLMANSQDMPRNGLRDGDKFTQYQITFVDTVTQGHDKVWNLTETTVSDAFPVEIALLNDSLKIFQILRHGERSVTYLRQRPEAIDLMGFENNLWRVDLSNGQAYLRSKSHNEQAVSDSLHGKGTYCERFRYSLSGRYTLRCDASGMLIFPEGDTIRNVSRLHSVQTFTHRFLNGNMPDLGPLLLDSRRWYAPGYRYPIAETQKLIRQTSGNVLLQTAYYTPLAELMALRYDPENMKIRENEAAVKHLSISVNNTDIDFGQLSAGGDNIRYSFTHDSAGQTVSIRFLTNQAETVEFILSDIIGIVYSSTSRQCQPGEEYTLTIPYGSIQGSGSFVLYISAGDNRYAEKFHK